MGPTHEGCFPVVTKGSNCGCSKWRDGGICWNSSHTDTYALCECMSKCVCVCLRVCAVSPREALALAERHIFKPPGGADGALWLKSTGVRGVSNTDDVRDGLVLVHALRQQRSCWLTV